MKFSKIFLAALLGCIAAGVLSSFLWFISFTGMVAALSFSSDSEIVKPNTVLVIELDEQIADSPQNSPLANFNFSTLSMNTPMSLLDALYAIERAGEDDNIAGIQLSPSISMQINSANLGELREELSKFKENGKFIVAYNDIYTQGGYYLASVADNVYLQPEGMVMWQGLSSNTMFYKGLFDKYDIKVEAIRPTNCEFKSAVEPYTRSNMSAESRAQMQTLLDAMWNNITDEVAESRRLAKLELKDAAQSLSGFIASDALESHLVDSLVYLDGLKAIYDARGVKLNEDDTYNSISLSSYSKATKPQFSATKDKVAVIYAEGAIVNTASGSKNDVVDVKTFVSRVRKARDDKNVKAVVLRVNSPGGDALAADIMWRELELLREQKPLIVSMGGYAASGGYYIAAPADTIVADKNTLTGSIGVFSLVPQLEQAMNKQLGITTDMVATNSSAGFLSTFSTLTPSDKMVLQHRVDQVYTRFMDVVCQGRDLPLGRVMEIAQGRVWGGVQAKNIGLVDEIGGVKRAIEIAAAKAQLGDKYGVIAIKPTLTGVDAFLAGLNAQVRAFKVQSERNELKNLYNDYAGVKSSLDAAINGGNITMYSPYRVDL